ncbi:MAG: methyltransferase [Pseudonocardiales bacterium]|nr:methyltransferase [Pseudonocardiales bacterium]
MIQTCSSRSCHFGSLVISYDQRVLEPRPWTLMQSEWAAELCTALAPGPLLELCAGAGHIGLAAAVLANRDLVQVELDPIAAGYAKINADAAGWGARVDVRNERLEEALRHEELFTVILADPPYLPSAAIARWPEDPPGAIDGGPDGLDLIKACLVVAADHLLPGGHLLLQIAGPAQADQVTDLLTVVAPRLTRRSLRTFDDERAILLIERAAH